VAVVGVSLLLYLGLYLNLSFVICFFKRFFKLMKYFKIL